MCPNRNWFKIFNAKESDIVYMGNHNACKVQGIGDITFKLHGGKIKLLTNVKFVLDLKRNLLSFGTYDETGVYVKRMMVLF